jgi:prolyl oligopeptidase
MTRLIYPNARTSEQIDTYHGVPVADPYRWLEDSDSTESQAWIAAQNELAASYLSAIPARPAIMERVTGLINFPKAFSTLKRGGRYFQMRNTGLQNQPVLYVMDSLNGEARVLLDPNTLSTDGTVALSGVEVSPDGRWLAYSVSASGSDWQTWHVRSVDSQEDLADVVMWSKFSPAAWKPDGSGFFYARYDEPQPGADLTAANYYHKLYFHRLNTTQAQDQLVYQRPDQREWNFAPIVSEDGCYLVIQVWVGTDPRNLLFYQDLHGGGEVVELISQLEANYIFIGNVGPLFYLRTDLHAPRGKLITIDLGQPARAAWQTLIRESEDTLEALVWVGHELIAQYVHDAHYRLKRFSLAGDGLGEIALPTLGTVQINPQCGDELFYDFSSFLYPSSVYRFNFEQNQSEVVFSPPLKFEREAYVTRQVFVSSKDGAQIPLFLTHRRELAVDGQNPTLLYGYGGFSISLTPDFSPMALTWLELGGVYAYANLRGGGEYGEDWHQAGTLRKKQNVFDDFIACAEWLIAENITSAPKLAIYGRSNGGLLVGACLTQRPDLFGATLPAVGVMDMLRYHKFTIGWAWASDYGSADDPEQFATLLAYSPLHNLRPGTAYPPTLVTTADHDDRVVPGHSFKFAAALQAAQAGEAPALIRIQTKAGHGFGKPIAIVIEETSDMLAFLVRSLGMQGGS